MEVLSATESLNQDHLAREFLTNLGRVSESSGIIDVLAYYDFPLFRDDDSTLYRSKLLVASRSHGVQVIGFHAGVSQRAGDDPVATLDEALAQLTSILVGKLLKSRSLRRTARELMFPVDSVIIDLQGDTASHSRNCESIVLGSYAELPGFYAERKLPRPLGDAEWPELRASLEGARALVRPKERNVSAFEASSKPARLARLESEVANFDASQRRAALQIVRGPQRIRGLAGSGKTIVLAMKAAHLHLADSSAPILVTFSTKSLYGFLKQLITRFYRQFNDHDPDWDVLHLRHSWGGSTTPGVYYDAAVAAGLRPLTYTDAMAKGGFKYACQELLKTQLVQQRYEHVLIDEAQDAPQQFYRLCFALAAGDRYDRNVIWAYDELQNIMNVRQRSVQETFGVDEYGVPLMDLSRAEAEWEYGSRDIVLRKCYRNPREILLAAHSLGFGIYSEYPVQMLENAAHWEDVGYSIVRGECAPGQRVIIERPEENSPITSLSDSPTESLIECYEASSFEDEVRWAIHCVRGAIEEGLNGDDIMVICLDDHNARNYLREIGAGLVGSGIKINNMQANPYGAPPFTVPDHVTLTTVYRAKGNEAAFVVALGVDALFPGQRLQRVRNRLFTAFTRAKAWLRVSGLGEDARFFFREIEEARRHYPNLEFTYPDPEKIATIQRDWTDKASRLRELRESITEQLDLIGLPDDEAATWLESIIRPKS